MYLNILKNECSYFAGVKVRIYPSHQQKKIIDLNSHASRWYYNKLVELWKESLIIKEQLENKDSDSTTFENLETRLSDIKKMTYNPTDIKKQIDWLQNPVFDSMMSYAARDDYRKAWNMWRKTGSGTPNFKKRGHSWKYGTTSGVILTRNRIKLAKIGKIRTSTIRKNFIHEELYVGRTTIRKESDGKYYASINIGSKEPFHKKLESTGSRVGIDLNLSNLYTDSDGDVIKNPKYLVKNLKKIKKANRAYSIKYEAAKRDGRDIKEAKNLEKVRLELAKIHKRVRLQREAYLHQVSKKLIENQDEIYVEDLQTKNLMKNKKLARAIADVGWGIFVQMLEYKSEMYGRTFAKVDPKYTTQTCNICEHVMAGKHKIKLGVEEWSCPSCGTHHNRDKNAAINILNKGLELRQ